jgi:hypothetical protein
MQSAGFRQQLQDALKGSENVCVRIGWPIAKFVLRLPNREIELSTLNFHVHATEAESELTIANYELVGDSIEKRMIQHASADIAGKKFDFLMPDGPQSKKVILSIGKCDKQKQ